MRHEPCRLVGYSEHTMKLVGAHSLLGRAKQMDCQKPFMQGNMAVFEDRAYCDCELLATCSALPNALPNMGFAIGLCLKPVGLANNATMRAYGSGGPAHLLQESACLIIITKVLC